MIILLMNLFWLRNIEFYLPKYELWINDKIDYQYFWIISSINSIKNVCWAWCQIKIWSTKRVHYFLRICVLGKLNNRSCIKIVWIQCLVWKRKTFERESKTFTHCCSVMTHRDEIRLIFFFDYAQLSSQFFDTYLYGLLYSNFKINTQQQKWHKLIFFNIQKPMFLKIALFL